MSDGCILATDVYRPAGEGRFPTLIQRDPYNKDQVPRLNEPLDVLQAVEAGYAVVIQDTRGRYASSGTFTQFSAEGKDGAETVEWAAAQAWSSGSVGMIGASYPGAAAWLAAAEAPSALAAIATHRTSANFFDGWAYRSGAFELGFNLYWSLLLAEGELERQHSAGANDVHGTLERVRHLVGSDDLYTNVEAEGLAALCGAYAAWRTHRTCDAYWHAVPASTSFATVRAATFNVGGWYDIFLRGTLESYRQMKLRRPGEGSPRLVIGPWAHGGSSGQFPERNFGAAASEMSIDLNRMQLGWFDSVLRQQGRSSGDDLPVKFFVIGPNEWREALEWPPHTTAPTPLYLDSAGHANTSSGDGALATTPPRHESHDQYTFDPSDAIPTTGGATFLPGRLVAANAGPRDQRLIEARKDVLCFTTDPLLEDVEVIGPVEAILYASAPIADMDFTAALIDVHLDGRAELLTNGIVRGRGLRPGEVHELRIDLVATATVFSAGHRIRVDISSSNFPRFDLNPDAAAFGRHAPLRNRLFHGGRYPSRVVLPVEDDAALARAMRPADAFRVAPAA